MDVVVSLEFTQNSVKNKKQVLWGEMPCLIQRTTTKLFGADRKGEVTFYNQVEVKVFHQQISDIPEKGLLINHD